MILNPRREEALNEYANSIALQEENCIGIQPRRRRTIFNAMRRILREHQNPQEVKEIDRIPKIGQELSRYIRGVGTEYKTYAPNYLLKS